jgi:hypothetical protein
MCVSALGTDPRPRRAMAAEAMGLPAWVSARFPTRREILTECLDRGGGRAPASLVLRRIEAVFHEPIRRYALPILAGHCGAAVQGKWIVRKAGSPTPP